MPAARPRPLFLLAFANDRADDARHLRNLPDEARRIEDALKPAAGLCEVVLRYNVTGAQLLDLLQDFRGRLAVLHYAGHADGSALALEAADGSPQPLAAAALAAFVREQGGLPLAFLNGCSTRPQVDAFLAAGVSAVVATSRAIDDATATDFAARFYRGLGGGAPIGVSFREAAAAQVGGSAVYRNLSPAGAASAAAAGEWPWSLTPHPGVPDAERWSVPAAAGDPLFGLPALPALDRPNAPYRHLRPFAREHAAVFFGRGREVRALYHRVADPGEPPVVLLYGQAGAGKSSLLDAGLLPRLEATHEVRYLRRRDAGLLDTLATALLPESADRPLADAWRAKEEARGRPLVVVLDQVEEAYTRPVAGLVDEVGTLLDAVVPLFADPAARPAGRLVLGFRKEWLPEVEKGVSDRRLSRAGVFLERLDRAGAAEAVGLSAEVTGWFNLSVEAGLAARVADDLLEDPNSPVAPTLQVLLATLWEAARVRDRGSPVIDGPLYDDLRRQGLHLGDFLDRQLAELKTAFPRAVESGLALDVLAFHTTPLGTAGQRGERELLDTYSHRADDVRAVVRRCQELYLLADWREDQARHEAVTRLAHDTLAPLVRRRFDESDAPGQRARRLLDNRSPEWADGSGLPLDEADLAVVEAGVGGTRRWSDAERRLVETSRRRQAIRRRWVVGARAAATAAVAIIAGLAVWASALNAGLEGSNKKLVKTQDELEGRNKELKSTLDERDEEARKVRRTASASLAHLASLSVDGDPQLGLLFAAEAVRQYSDHGDLRLPAADGALLSALSRVGGRGVVGTRGKATATVVSPRGRWLVRTAWDGTACVWDLHAADPLSTRLELAGTGLPIFEAKFSPDENWLLTVETEDLAPRTATLWEIGKGRNGSRVVLPTIARKSRHPGLEDDLFFTGDGRLFGVTDGPGTNTARLWDLPANEVRPPSIADNARVAAVCSKRRWVVLWDGDVLDLQGNPRRHPASLGRQKRMDGATSPIQRLSVAFSPDGLWLATSGCWGWNDMELEGGTTLWRLTDSGPAEVRLTPGIVRFEFTEQFAPEVAFSPDGRWLVAKNPTGAAPHLWALDAGKARAELRVLGGEVVSWKGYTFTFSPDSRRLAAAGGAAPNGTEVRLYRMPTGTTDPSQAVLPRVARILGKSGEVLAGPLAVEFLQGDSRFITHPGPASARGYPYRAGFPAQLWIDSPEGVLSLDSRLHGGRDVPFWTRIWPLPDGGILTADDGRTVCYWPAAEGSAPVFLRGHIGPVVSCSFSRDAGWIVTSSSSESILWDMRIRSPNRFNSTPLRGPTGAFGDLAHFAPNGKLFTAGGQDGVRLWDLNAVEPPNTGRLVPHPGFSETACVSSDGKWVVTIAAGAGDNGESVAWVTERGPPPAGGGQGWWPRHRRLERQAIRNACISTAGRLVAVSGNRVEVFDANATNIVDTRESISAGSSEISALAIDPIGHHLAIGFRTGSVSVWDVSRPGHPRQLRSVTAHKSAVASVYFYTGPQGNARRVLASTGGGVASIWDIHNDNAVTVIEGAAPEGKETEWGAVAPLVDGRLATARSGEGVRVMRPVAEPGVPPDVLDLGPLPAGKADAWEARLATSPDGRWLVLSGIRRHAYLWDLTAKPTTPIPLPLSETDTHLGSFAFSQSSVWLAGVGPRGVYLWDLRAIAKGNVASALVARGKDIRDHISHIWFDGDHALVGSGSWICRFPLQADEMLAEAKSCSNRQFTVEEWDRYFPGLPYRWTFGDLPGPTPGTGPPSR